MYDFLNVNLSDNTGKIGSSCLDVCTNFNPCQNWADCLPPRLNEQDYRCECGERQSGRYCQNVAPKTCPVGWWGKPVCGPCNCDTQRGFRSACNTDNGKCICKVS